MTLPQVNRAKSPRPPLPCIYCEDPAASGELCDECRAELERNGVFSYGDRTAFVPSKIRKHLQSFTPSFANTAYYSRLIDLVSKSA